MIEEDKGEAYTEKEIRQVYHAMINGTIETILQGEKELDDQPWDDDDLIPEAQRIKPSKLLLTSRNKRVLGSRELCFRLSLRRLRSKSCP